MSLTNIIQSTKVRIAVQAGLEVDDLVAVLNKQLASTYTVAATVQGLHWNHASDFAVYHAPLGALYEDLIGQVDTLAERIRSIGKVAPSGLKRMLELSEVQDEIADVVTTEEMLSAVHYALLRLSYIAQTAMIISKAVNDEASLALLSELDLYYQKMAWQYRGPLSVPAFEGSPAGVMVSSLTQDQKDEIEAAYRLHYNRHDRVLVNLGTAKKPKYYSGTVIETDYKEKDRIKIRLDIGKEVEFAATNTKSGLIGLLRPGVGVWDRPLPLDFIKHFLSKAPKFNIGETK